MAADLPTFRVAYPEFAPVADEVVQYYLDEAVGYLDAQAWGPCFTRAALAYAAHLLALSQARQASAATSGGAVVIQQTGQITSASAEGLSVGFAAPPAQDQSSAWFSQTPYGQAYLAYQRQCLSRGRLSW